MAGPSYIGFNKRKGYGKISIRREKMDSKLFNILIVRGLDTPTVSRVYCQGLSISDIEEDLFLSEEDLEKINHLGVGETCEIDDFPSNRFEITRVE